MKVADRNAAVKVFDNTCIYHFEYNNNVRYKLSKHKSGHYINEKENYSINRGGV
jgi:hypothetical protein